jgi:hypothetical protein
MRRSGAPVHKFKSFLIDVVSGALAYVLARWIFSGEAGVFDRLHWELLTFGVLYGLFQLLIRGWRLARKGKSVSQ